MRDFHSGFRERKINTNIDDNDNKGDVQNKQRQTKIDRYNVEQVKEAKVDKNKKKKNGTKKPKGMKKIKI